MKGRFVLSIAGRDKNRIFVVLEVLNEEYVLIADGKLRKIGKPKKKKLKHLKLLEECMPLPCTNKSLYSEIKKVSLYHK